MYRRDRAFVVAISAALAAAACGRDDAPVAPRVEPEAVAPVLGPTNVRPCDEYLAQYGSCIAKMEEPDRATFALELAEKRATFLRGATSTSGRDALIHTCKAAFSTLPSRCK